MAGVTIAALCRTLSDDLRPIHPREPPEIHVNDIHASELPDPTAHLDGGELLLTIGKALPHSVAGCREYVERLVRGNVAALGFGSAIYPSVPPRLIRACREAGLCLLHVPPPSRFLTIGRVFWLSASRSDQRDLSVALTAHRDLVNATVSAEPVNNVLRALGSAVSGWAAFLDGRGELLSAWPAERGTEADLLRDETVRLRGAGVHAAATFPLDDDEVVVHPLAAGDQVVGYLATAVPPPMSATDRRIVLTACALLSLNAALLRQKSARQEAAGTAVAFLLDLGQIGAARDLGNRMGLAVPDGPVRVLALDGVDEEAMRDVVGVAWPGREILGTCQDGTAWCLAPADSPSPDLVTLREALTKTCENGRALLGPPVELAQISSHRPRLIADLRRRPLSSVTEIAGGEENGTVSVDASRAQMLLAPLLDAQRPEVMEALAAYLRHHGQWEVAARELDVHRNTLRYRIDRAEEILDRDLRDPDTTASLWLALRATGLA